MGIYKPIFILTLTISFALLGGGPAQAATTTTSRNAALTQLHHQSGDLGITIDGDFTDWADKPKHAMTISGDDDNVKYVSLLTDNHSIYYYILMSPKLQGGYTNFQPSGYVLTVGGKTFHLSFNNHQTVTLNVGEKQAVAMNLYGSDGSNVNLSHQAYVSRQIIPQKLGDGTAVKGKGYVLECAIPLADLQGISSTSGQTISLKNPNLWTGSLKVSGGSTGPIVLAGIGALIAVGSVWQFSTRPQKRGPRQS